MGPAATLQFYQLVLDKTRQLTSAPTDQDHIQAVIEMNPHIVDRQKAILHGTDAEKCGRQMRESGARVKAGGADFAVCVCNTAHHFQKFMEEGLTETVPFLSIVDLTVQRIAQTIALATPVCSESKVANAMIVGVLAASGCVASGMYQRALGTEKIQYRVPDQSTQDRLMQAIYMAKSGKLTEGRAALDEVLTTMLDLGVKVLILGCTELPLLMSSPSPMDVCNDGPVCRDVAETKGDVVPAARSLAGVTFFNPNDILADTVVRVCKGMVKLTDVLPKKKNKKSTILQALDCESPCDSSDELSDEL